MITILSNDVQEFFDAIHEAGHAVAAAKLGLPFDYVTVVPNEFSRGHLMPASIGRPRRVYVIRRGAMILNPYLQNFIVVSLAGFSAQNSWFEPNGIPIAVNKKMYRASRDFVDAKKIVVKYAEWMDAERRAAYLDRMQRRADRLVLQERLWIKRVADTLCCTKTIGPKIVAELRHKTKIPLADGKSEITWCDDEPFLRVDGNLVHDRVSYLGTPQ
jgi:hypothetical protein